MDSCYLCEIGKDGLIVPLGDRSVLVCARCVLKCIYSHPMLAALLPEKEMADVH